MDARHEAQTEERTEAEYSRYADFVGEYVEAAEAGYSTGPLPSFHEWRTRRSVTHIEAGSDDSDIAF